MAACKLHIFTAVNVEANAVRPVLPVGAILTVIGISAVRLPQRVDARTVIMAGFAGALDPTLAIGDVIRDEPPGLIFTSPHMVATPRDKAILFERTGARAVDMENAIVRDFAQRMGAQFFGVRAISDTADESIDPRVMGCIDEIGQVRVKALVRGLITAPALIPALNRLRIHTAVAGRALAEGLRKMLEENRGMFE